MIISLGKYLNHLARPNVVVATNPAASAGFPAPNLYDGTPVKLFKFGAVPTSGIDGGEGGGTLNRVGTIDLCLLKNPGAELGLSGWKKVGTAAATTAQFNSGAQSWQIAADGALYQDVLVRSGERLGITGATRGDGASAEAYFGVQDIATGLALDSSGNWAIPDTDVGTGTAKVAQIKKLGAWTGASWLNTASIPFNALPYAATLKHLTTLRVVAAVGGAGNGFADDLVLIPGTDWCSLHGFNFPANMIVTVASSEAGAFAGEETARFSLAPFQPSFHQHLDAVFLARYLKFTLLGVRERLFLPFIGELIFTQAVTLEISARYGSAMSAEWPAFAAQQIKVKIKGKTKTQTIPASAAARAARTLSLPFRWFAESHWTQAREWFILRNRGQTEELLIAAPEFDSELVVYGIMTGPRGFALFAPDVRDSEAVVITEKTLPNPPAGEEI